MFKFIRNFLKRPIKIERFWKMALIVMAIVGIADTSYLTYTRYENKILNCFGHTQVNSCQVVAQSAYSTVLGVPISLIGLAFYIFVLTIAVMSLKDKFTFLLNTLLPLSVLAFLFSVRLTYLQVYVIESICYYCLVSALISVLLLMISMIIYQKMNLPE